MYYFKPTPSEPEPGPKKDGPGIPTAAGPITSPSKRIPKKARGSRGTGPVDGAKKITSLAALARRAVELTAMG